LLVYLSAGQSQPGNDATSNVHLALRLLEHGTVFFTPEDNPKMFFFALQSPGGKRPSRIRDWRMTYQGQPARAAYEQGLFRVHEPLYYLVPTKQPGKYASTFGLGAGLFALPVVAPVRALVSDLGSKLDLLWWLAKLAAALSVAGAVVFLYRAALRALTPRSAALVALAYGLGTCAFSISSQALWQHGPCELFLAMGAYFLLAKTPGLAQRREVAERGEAGVGREGSGPSPGGGTGNSRDLLSGLGFGMAVLCRPTVALVAACVGVHLLLVDRRRFLGFVLGGLPAAVILFAYSQYTFGSIFSFGQLGAGVEIAKAKTGQASLWQTPLWIGIPGLLASPARGLFVYTPIAGFAIWGIGRAFRDPAWKDLRPLAVAALLLLGLAAKWFDWWGGWCFGYRPIVDIAILLGFLSIPVAGAVSTSRVLKPVFVGLCAYSVGVQFLGAFAYDVLGWNGRVVWDVVVPGTNEHRSFDEKVAAGRFVRERGGKAQAHALNVDEPENRGRLWSVTDSPLIYYLMNFSAARQSREKATAEFLLDDG
jgi:hypothetical protein